jgi:hypothetical protein
MPFVAVEESTLVSKTSFRARRGSLATRRKSGSFVAVEESTLVSKTSFRARRGSLATRRKSGSCKEDQGVRSH